MFVFGMFGMFFYCLQYYVVGDYQVVDQVGQEEQCVQVLVGEVCQVQVIQYVMGGGGVVGWWCFFQQCIVDYVVVQCWGVGG